MSDAIADIYAGIIPDGSIGYDYAIVANGDIGKLVYNEDIGLALSKLREKDIDLSEDDFVFQLTESQRYLIYTIAIEKIAYKNDLYLIHSSYDDYLYTNILSIGESLKTFIEYYIDIPKTETKEVSFTPIIEYEKTNFFELTPSLSLKIEYDQENSPSFYPNFEPYIEYSIRYIPQLAPSLDKTIEYQVYEAGETELKETLSVSFGGIIYYSKN